MTPPLEGMMGGPPERVDGPCETLPLEDMTGGLVEKVDWPCVTSAQEDVTTGGPPEWVDWPCVTPLLEGVPCCPMEHLASPMATLLDGVLGSRPGWLGAS